MTEQTTGPIDGSAAELLDHSACFIEGCTEPPVTHRRGKVRLPVYTERNGEKVVADWTEQAVDVALCAPHDHQLAEVEVTIGETTGTL